MQKIAFTDLGINVSRLGFGCMRLPTVKRDGKDVIDEAEAVYMIRRAIDQGLNYVDTAYAYHDGASEPLVAKALRDGYRQKVYLATKLPCWLVETREDMDRLLDEQLEKLETDHIDFYLMHALSKKRFEKMKRLGYADFLDRAAAAGKIRYPAFSFHDDYEAFHQILNDYPWKMAQVQMNLLDDENQATLKGIQEAGDKGVGIVVMEPLRGGALARPPQEVQALYDAFPVKRSPAEWAFRYVYDLPQVMTVLSGMSTMEQVLENLEIFNHAEPRSMTGEERALLAQVKAAYLSRIKTGCTGCAYCQPCPKGVAIPVIFQGCDNAAMLDRWDGFSRRYQELTKAKNDAGQCAACGKCEKACPQHLHIIHLLQEIHREARP